jgi:hypothetical protein
MLTSIKGKMAVENDENQIRNGHYLKLFILSIPNRGFTDTEQYRSRKALLVGSAHGYSRRTLVDPNWVR